MRPDPELNRLLKRELRWRQQWRDISFYILLFFVAGGALLAVMIAAALVWGFIGIALLKR